MSKQSNKFQKLMTAIHACISKGISVEESALLTDRETRGEREVDIVLRSKIGDYPMILSVEVRDRSRPAGSGWVEEMAGKHQALQTNKLVLVSRSGFTKPAIVKAKAREIETLTIEEAFATDWNLVLQLEGRRVFQLFNISFSCKAHIVGRNDWLPAPFSAKLIMPSGELYSVGDFSASIVLNPSIKEAMISHFESTKEQEYHAVYNSPDGTLFERAPNVYDSLVKLAIGLHLDFEATPVKFATGRFRERDIAYAQGRESDNYLCIVFTRKENGKTEGVLYDSKGFRRLFIDS